MHTARTVRTSARKPKQKNLIPRIIIVRNKRIPRANILRQPLGRDPANDATQQRPLGAQAGLVVDDLRDTITTII